MDWQEYERRQEHEKRKQERLEAFLVMFVIFGNILLLIFSS